MTVRGLAHKLEKIPLKTVRPFILRETILANDLGIDKFRDEKAVISHLRKIVKGMIKDAIKDYTELNPDVSEEKVPRPW